MNRFCSIFSQLLQLFSRIKFRQAVKETKAERHARGFTCWGQFVAMHFCQLGRAHSLREITGGLRSCEGKLKHLGISAANRSTLAYAEIMRRVPKKRRQLTLIMGGASLLLDPFLFLLNAGEGSNRYQAWGGNMKLLKVLAIGLSFLLIGSFAFADTISLKDGRSYQGKFIKGDKNGITIESDGKIMGFPMSWVSFISFEEKALERKQSVDLDVPIERKVTVKSEIKRGAFAVHDVMLKTEINLDKAFLGISAMINENVQRNTDTEPLYLGAYCQAWVSFSSTLKVLKKSKSRYQGLVDRGERSAAFYFKEFRKRQEKMGINDENLFDVVGLKFDMIKPDIDDWAKKVK